MTPDTTLDPISEPIPTQPASTTGMTTKVVKGSVWTIGGSILPLAVSFISTPFVIRFLGSEAYGVLLLVGLIPTYFSFADFGMGIASTKFASEAHGRGDDARERDVVWTASAIAAVSSLAIALPIFLFSERIVAGFNVPEHLLNAASIGLKITSVAFVLGILSSVLNSPMLARLRMDLNAVTQAVPKLLLAAVTPFILYFGGGIVEAVSWTLVVGLVTLATVFYFSSRLLRELSNPRFDREMLRPLIKVGGALAISGIAAVLLVNFEKAVLVRLTSVQTLAYYSVASTLASTAIMLGTAMNQSLVPAFAQLLEPNRRGELEALFSRMIRVNIVMMVPLFVFLFVIARPFFTIWAGAEFGSASTTPFHIMIVALVFNLTSYVPVGVLLARGRMDVLAKVYWIELLPYIALLAFLTNRYGAIGAALGWSIRVVFDTCVMVFVSGRISGLSIRVFRDRNIPAVACFLVLLPAVFAALISDNVINWSLVILPASLLIYAVIVWTKLFHDEERDWVVQNLNAFHRRLRK